MNCKEKLKEIYTKEAHVLDSVTKKSDGCANEYAERDTEELGNYYAKHVQAMTAEGLHSKSDIAAELGYRDKLIDDANARIKELEAKYHELLSAVASAFPDESRHETALRYIRNAERVDNLPEQTQPPKGE